MSTVKIFETVNGFPTSLLISQTPMVCRLLLQSSGSISHEHPAVRKWFSSLLRLLGKSRDKSTTNKLKSEVNNSSEPQFLLDSTPISTDNDTKSQSNSKKCKRQNDIDGQQVWSACCLLSVTYRTISAGYKDWARHFNDILDVLECGEVFYNPVVRGRCLETLCEMIEYSRCMHDYSSFHQSIQLSSKIVRFLQSIMVQIVLTKDKALNPGGRLLQTVLMIQYRILAQGKSLRSNDTTLTAKTCYHCLASNDSKTRSVAIGILVLLANSEDRYNELMDKISWTLHYLLRDLFPKTMITSYHSDTHRIEPKQCISHILEIIPKRHQMDTFDRIALYDKLMSGLIYLLCHLIRRKSSESMETVCSSSTRSVKISRALDGPNNVKILASSCSMNALPLRIPVQRLFLLISDITSISISECLKFGNLIEYTPMLQEQNQNVLWLLVTVVSSVQRSILPYSNLIRHVLVSVAKETQSLHSPMDWTIRSALYRSMLHIIPVLGPSAYDVFYEHLKVHIITDLKAAQKLLMTSPPNPATLHQKSRMQLLTEQNYAKFKLQELTERKKKKPRRGKGPSKTKKLNKMGTGDTDEIGNLGDSEVAVYLQREYDSKLSFYPLVCRVIAALFGYCSVYMSFDEKSEVEIILSSAVLGCCSEGGHILVNLCAIELLEEFVGAMVAVLLTPKMYKKPYLSLSRKLLSSCFGIGSVLSNKRLMEMAQTGLRYVDSVVNPRSTAVYNAPYTLWDEMDLNRSANGDGEKGSLRQIRRWDRKMMLEIVAEERAKNIKSTETQRYEKEEEEDEDFGDYQIEEDDDENDDDDQNESEREVRESSNAMDQDDDDGDDSESDAIEIHDDDEEDQDGDVEKMEKTKSIRLRERKGPLSLKSTLARKLNEKKRLKRTFSEIEEENKMERTTKDTDGAKGQESSFLAENDSDSGETEDVDITENPHGDDGKSRNDAVESDPESGDDPNFEKAIQSIIETQMDALPNGKKVADSDDEDVIPLWSY